MLHAFDTREGTDVVLLLHAFPLNARMWAAEVSALSPRMRVVAPDYPGLGRSAPGAVPSTMGALAEDVLAILDGLRISRAAVVGLSMGGYLAFELHRRRPALFRALALCDTRAGADTPEAAAIREAFAQRVLAEGLGWVPDALMPRLLRRQPAPEAVATVRALVAEGTPAGVAAAQRAMAGRPDSAPLLVTIACPTLVVVGEEDSFTPPAESRKMAAAIRGSTLVEIPGAGHLSNLEQPSAFGRALGGFLDSAFRS